MNFLSLYCSKSVFPARSEPAVFRCLVGRRRWLAGWVLLTAMACQFGGTSPLKATATPTPAPSPVVAPTATPESAPKARNYDGSQQSAYIKTAVNAFVEARGAKANAFVAASNAYQEAGGASVKGLSSKEAITERRELIQKASQTNDDYLAFVETQDATYQDDLSKTPLTKEDVDAIVAEFSAHAKADLVIKLRGTTGDMLKTGDTMMEFLEKKYGTWKLNDNRLTFKKAADTNAFSALSKKYNTYVEGVQKMSAEVNSSLPTPGTSPIPDASPSLGATPAAGATVNTPTASPIPSPKLEP